MHSYFHAMSSVRAYGGTIDDYLSLHSFLDATKEHYAGPLHRMFLHSTWGIYFVEGLVGATYQRSDGRTIPLRLIIERHIAEDLGRVPTLHEWLNDLVAYEIVADDILAHAHHSATLFGGTWKDYRIPHEQMNRVAQVMPDARSQRILHNAWGITLLETMLGETFTRVSDGHRVSTRMVLEEHVRCDCNGRIPSMQDCVQGIPLKEWMYKPALASSRQFIQQLKGALRWTEEETVLMPVPEVEKRTS